MLALVNFLFIKDGNPLLQQDNNPNGSGGVHDCTRNTDYIQNKDADLYLLKLDPSTGYITWSKNVGHVSGEDFRPGLAQNPVTGDYIISATTADYYNGLSDLTTPVKEDYFLIETLDNSTAGHVWRRNFHQQGVTTNCAFGVATTSDGGLFVYGNNEYQDDDFSVVKLSNPCLRAAATTGVYTATTETWPSVNVPNNSNMGKQVVAPYNKVLTINSMTLNLADSRNMYDYWDLANNISGSCIQIIVQPGGKVVINSGVTLKAMTCNSYNIQMKSLMQVQSGILSSGRTVFKMTEDEEKTIRDISSTNTPAGRQAKNLLTLVYGEVYPEEFPSFDEKDQKQFQQQDDPASDYFQVNLHSATVVENTQLSIYDALGRLVFSIPLSTVITEFHEASKLHSGIYLLQVSESNRVIGTEKLNIQK